jgi:hypothetical protein
MTEIEQLLGQINKNPQLLAKMDIIEETGVFDRERMRQILVGLRNERMINAFIRLTVNKWNTLKARHDKRLIEQEEPISSFLETIKTDELHARELEAKELAEQQEIIRELGMLDDDILMTDDDYNLMNKDCYMVVSKAAHLLKECALEVINGQTKEEELLKSKQQQNELLAEVKEMILSFTTELDALKSENDQLKSENAALTSEVTILRAEHAHTSQTQQERDEAVRHAAELNKSLEETKEQLGKRYVRLQDLVDTIMRIPYQEMKQKCLEVLSYLLAGNKYWVEFRDKLNEKEIEKSDKQKQPSVNAEHYYAEGAHHDDHSRHLGIPEPLNPNQPVLE